MRKLLSAMVVVFSMGMTGSVCTQDLEKGFKAWAQGDHSTAFKELIFLAERGDVSAQYHLGDWYWSIDDRNQSLFWYRKAGEQGYLDAQTFLAENYVRGFGSPVNNKEAVIWYRKAAEQGDAMSQYNLGVMYANGKGVIQDKLYAHMWFNVAYSNGREEAKDSRDIIVKIMTVADVSKAQELARECVKKQYKGC